MHAKCVFLLGRECRHTVPNCSAGTDAEQAGLTVPAFFQALHVVFLHENFLLTLRQLAFGGRSQSRESAHPYTPTC